MIIGGGSYQCPDLRADVVVEDWDQLQAMTDDLLDATARWLPQFA